MYDTLNLGIPKNKPVTNERELLIAVLERAVFDHYGSNLSNREAATDWLFDREIDDELPFSFGWVCRHLGLEQEGVRKRVQALVGERDFKGGHAQSHRWLRTKVQSNGRTLDYASYA